MVLETIRSMTGEGKAVADNENLSTALGHIDTGATFVMAADKVKTNDTETLSGETDTDSPLVTFGVSMNLGDDLELNVFLKGENERAKQDLINVRLGLQMAESLAGPGIDQAMSQVPPDLKLLADSWATFAKEFVASLDVEDVDGGIAFSASASLPEGGLVGALAQAAPMLMGFYSMTDIVPGEALQQVEEVESPMNTYTK